VLHDWKQTLLLRSMRSLNRQRQSMPRTTKLIPHRNRRIGLILASLPTSAANAPMRATPPN